MKAAPDTAWSAPSLSDFTSKSWGDLTDAEKRGIASHFLYAENMPPKTFGELHLPHHRASDGAVNFNGVVAATGRLNQTSMASGDMAAAKAHLRAHYAQFGKPVPDSLRVSEEELSRGITIDQQPLTFRADFRPNSLNVESRTVEMVFSTGAGVERYDPSTGRRYLEVLSLKPSHVRLDRLNSGAPLLNTHGLANWPNGPVLSDVLGVVVSGSARVSRGEGSATVRFSKRPDVEPIFQDVRDGILPNVSVAYRTHKYERTPAADENSLEVRTAVDWEPREISAVPIGADAGAQVRADEQPETNPCVIVTREHKEMNAMEDQTRDETQTTATETEATAERTESTEMDIGAEAERGRITGILRACEAARLPMSFAKKLIDDKTALLEAQTQVLDTLRRSALDDQGPKPGPSGARVGSDPLEHVWRGITGALLHRIRPDVFKLDDNAKQYRTYSVLRTAEECLEQRGTRTRGMSKMEIAGLALGLTQRAGYNGTSDYALILADVGGKTLLQRYNEQPPTWLPLARRIQIGDFKPIKRLRFGEAPELKKVLEHGEFTHGTVPESKEQFSLSTYGRIFGVTRQAIVNDDLGAFGDMATNFAQSARRKESDLVWAEILRNAAMADGQDIFSVAHNNLTTGPGTAIAVTSLGIGRAKIENQKGLDGTSYLNLDAAFLIVPPGQRTLAQQLTQVITPELPSGVNPFSGEFRIISEPRLEGGLLIDGETIAGSSTAWYLASDPGMLACIEYGYLDGQEGPTVESRVGWDVDGLELKCREDFAAHVTDFRGLYKNTGA